MHDATVIDIEAEHQRLARETFTEGGVAQQRARTIAGAALDVLPRLTDGHYDLVFCDGDKAEYAAYLKEALRLLRPGGVVQFPYGADARNADVVCVSGFVTAGAKVKIKDAEGKPLEIERAATLARWTFIVDKDGKVAYKNTKVTPADDAKKITEFITEADKK